MVERVDGFRQMLSDILTVNATLVNQAQNEEIKNLTVSTYDQNEQVKRISAWAAILFAPTLIGTVYGMNFTDLPGVHESLGLRALAAPDARRQRGAVRDLQAPGLALNHSPRSVERKMTSRSSPLLVAKDFVGFAILNAPLIRGVDSLQQFAKRGTTLCAFAVKQLGNSASVDQENGITIVLQFPLGLLAEMAGGHEGPNPTAAELRSEPRYICWANATNLALSLAGNYDPKRSDIGCQVQPTDKIDPLVCACFCNPAQSVSPAPNQGHLCDPLGKGFEPALARTRVKSHHVAQDRFVA